MDILNILLKHEDILRAEQVEEPEDFKGKVKLYSIRYKSGDCEVEGFMSAPVEFDKELPAIIFNRGGNREFGALRPIVVCRYASFGYIALGSQYRGNCGGTGHEEFGGSDVDDVIKLIDIALDLPFVHKGGVYMAGHSRGGMMTYLACARDSRIKAATIGAGLADSVMMYETREQSMKDVYHELVGGSPKDMPEAFEKRSAVCWADKIIPPILICQGTADWRVVPEQAYKMDRELTKAGKEHKLIVYDGADHSLKGTTYIKDVISWFKSHPF